MSPEAQEKIYDVIQHIASCRRGSTYVIAEDLLPFVLHLAYQHGATAGIREAQEAIHAIA